MSSLHSSSAVQCAGRSRRLGRDNSEAGGAKISRVGGRGGEGEFEALRIATPGQGEINYGVCLGGSLEKSLSVLNLGWPGTES